MIEAPPPLSNTTLVQWRNTLWRQWFGEQRYGRWVTQDTAIGLACDLREHRAYEWLQATWRLLDYNPRPRPDELLEALVAVTGLPHNTNTVTALFGQYQRRYRDSELSRDLGLSHSPIDRATPARLPDQFRSDYERRAAAALTRLGIEWDYEPDVFHWKDYRGVGHRYTPDFRLIAFAATYVEVKGLAGADVVDTIKMGRVLSVYPNLTLLLWDAATIEYIEDVTDPSAIVGLLRTTALAA